MKSESDQSSSGDYDFTKYKIFHISKFFSPKAINPRQGTTTLSGILDLDLPQQSESDQSSSGDYDYSRMKNVPIDMCPKAINPRQGTTTPVPCQGRYALLGSPKAINPRQGTTTTVEQFQQDQFCCCPKAINPRQGTTTTEVKFVPDGLLLSESDQSSSGDYDDVVQNGVTHPSQGVRKRSILVRGLRPSTRRDCVPNPSPDESTSTL